MIASLLRDIVNRRLESAGGTVYVDEGSVSGRPDALWLGFEGMGRLRFAGTSDGYHFVVDHVEPKEFDMQEIGSQRFLDVSGVFPMSRAKGSVLRQAWLIVSPGPTDVIGVRLDFDQTTIRLINWGDELYIGQGLPADADATEIAELRAY